MGSAALSLCAAFTASAQQPASYQATATPRSYYASNPHHLYWVRGGDTVGTPITAAYFEQQEWGADAAGLRIRVRQLGGLPRSEKVDTFRVTSNGRVVSINGDSATLRGRTDLLPRLPDPIRPLVPGTEWSDSVGTFRRAIAGDYVYMATRRYRVTRQLDTLGRRLVEIENDGYVRYRDEFRADSAAGTYSWLDVAGPERGSVLLDVEDGTVLLRRWEMQLSGVGGLPEARDTLPAGLRSAYRQALISDSVARLAMRPLPVGDTTVTVSGGSLLFLHTVRSSGDTVSSSFVRADGLIGTVFAVYEGGRPQLVRTLWTDSTGARRTEITARGSSLEVRDSTSRTVRIPREHWAIADYAMSEHLVPLFRSLPADGQPRQIAVYRPVPARWDERRVVIQAIPEGIVATIQGPGPEEGEVHLVLANGDLLFVETMGRSSAQRLPPPASTRFATLRAIIERVTRAR